MVKRPSMSEAKLQLSGVKRPTKWQDIIPMLFPGHKARQDIAILLLQRIKEGEEKHEVITTSEWLPISLEAMKLNPMYEDIANALEKKWLELEEAGKNRVEILKELAAYAEELKGKGNVQGPNPFHYYKNNFYFTVKYLAKARMIHQDGSVLKVSTEFGKRLQRLAELWLEFAQGEEDW